MEKRNVGEPSQTWLGERIFGRAMNEVQARKLEQNVEFCDDPNNPREVSERTRCVQYDSGAVEAAQSTKPYQGDVGACALRSKKRNAFDMRTKKAHDIRAAVNAPTPLGGGARGPKQSER